MVNVEPAVFVVLPFIILALYRRSWAFLFVVGSTPFFDLEMFYALSHQFRLPEIAIMILIGHYLIYWLREGSFQVKNSAPVLLLWAFLGVCGLSVLALVVQPAMVQVHPYFGSYQSRLFIDLAVSSKNVSQLFIRTFFVLSVTVLTIHLEKEGLREAIRGIVFGAVMAGLFGMAYQLMILSNLNGLLAILVNFGFGRLPTSPGFLGPIPRMFSMSGEPGYVADFLLYALGIVLTLSILPGQNDTFHQKELRFLTPFLGVPLLLSTGTTGYGGLVILIAVLTGVLAVFPDMRPNSLPLNPRAVIPVTGVMIILAVLAIGPQLIDIISYQVQKMTFQAGSGDIRMFYMSKSIEIFLERPVIGVGVGSHNGLSVLFTVLAETGLLGAITLMGAHMWAFRQCVGVASYEKSSTRNMSMALAVAGFTLLATHLIAKSATTLLFPWYWFSLALPIAFVTTRWER